MSKNIEEQAKSLSFNACFRGTILVDIYADDEIVMDNVENIHKAIEQFYLQIPVDAICIKSGENYLSDEVFDYSIKNNCLHNKVICVIKNMATFTFLLKCRKLILRIILLITVPPLMKPITF